MPVRTVKPITPGQRGKTISTFEEITKSKPEKSLLVPLKRTGGRNNTGKMTQRRFIKTILHPASPKCL